MEIDVKYVAQLAKIDLTPQQIDRFQKQFQDILNYVEKLKKLNTDGVSALSYAVSLKNVFRDDKPKSSLDIRDVLKNAPQKKGNFFKVPRVIK